MSSFLMTSIASNQLMGCSKELEYQFHSASYRCLAKHAIQIGADRGLSNAQRPSDDFVSGPA